MVTPCLLYSRVNCENLLPESASKYVLFSPIVLGLFHECLICCLGREEEMHSHPLARYEYFKLYEIADNLELVSEISW